VVRSGRNSTRCAELTLDAESSRDVLQRTGKVRAVQVELDARRWFRHR